MSHKEIKIGTAIKKEVRNTPNPSKPTPTKMRPAPVPAPKRQK
ncbi:hypothetical protein [Leuconostoc mesenteroides]|nr:hypothetical protein [Leuconostoc mesenteroides]